MRLLVAAVGKLRDAAFRDLWKDYAGRLNPAIELVEVEEKRPLSVSERRLRESQLLQAALPPRMRLVALDGGGKMLDSEGLAAKLGAWRGDSPHGVAFLIGGADGHDPKLLAACDLTLSLGPMTWPHQLARVMLAEQLYRADRILAGHPYHRGE
jgi:23S rRNA (pseudouridine1915-N3)-methyltransferase